MPGAFLVNNLISASATLTPSTEDSAYPIENIYGLQAANLFRSESKTAFTLLLDFGLAVIADTLAIINHNFTDAVVLSLKAGSVNPPTTIVASPSYRAHDIWKAFSSLSARYWLLTVTDSNPDNLELGQLLIGTRTTMPRARLMGSYKPAKKRSNLTEETYAGVPYVYHLFERHEFNPSFRVATAAELAILSALDDQAYGNFKPFLWIPDHSQADCYYVRKQKDFEPEEQRGRLPNAELVHDYQMLLVEESRGLDIQE
jgi:hypothetical protein